MAKGYLTSKFSGKLGSMVMVVNHGVQIAREYNPSPSDAKTAGQVQARAKFKLLAQLGEVLAPAIGMRRVGLVSPRNEFMKRNYGSVAFADSEATIDMTLVDLTAGAVGIAAPSVTRRSGQVQVDLANLPSSVNGVVLAIVTVGDDNSIKLNEVQTVTEIPDTRAVQVVFGQVPSDVTGYVYAYGVMATTSGRDVYTIIKEKEGDAFVEAMRLTSEGQIVPTETRSVAFEQYT